MRQFVSYYRRFIAGFANIAHPLHALTRTGVKFLWSPNCQQAFDVLKFKLCDAPILAYPNFNIDFVLETDVSGKGLGAVLSQCVHGSLHPIVFASRALSPSERNYSITDLETLAIVWACSHFRAYLYGHIVTVFTDHLAAKAVLQSPSLNGKHARWWTKLYSSGIYTPFTLRTIPLERSRTIPENGSSTSSHCNISFIITGVTWGITSV